MRSWAWERDHLHSSVVQAVPSPLPKLSLGMGMSQELIPTSSLGAATLIWELKDFNSVSEGYPILQYQGTFLGRYQFPVFQLQTPSLGESVIEVTHVDKWMQSCSQLEGKGQDVFFHPERALQRAVWWLWLKSGSAVT